jgi:hypothetical protein
MIFDPATVVAPLLLAATMLLTVRAIHHSNRAVRDIYQRDGTLPDTGLAERVANLEQVQAQHTIMIRDIEGATHRHNGHHPPTYTYEADYRPTEGTTTP